MGKTGAFLAFLAGATAGAAAGLLLAPTSGKESREKLNKELDEFTEKARKAANEQYKQASEKMEDAKKQTVKYVEDRLKK